MKVYVISSGCVHEGGGVDGVFINSELANKKFLEMIEEKREWMKGMEEFEDQRAIEHGSEYRSRIGYWMEEEVHEEDNKKWIIFHGQDYITLKTWDCEE